MSNRREPVVGEWAYRGHGPDRPGAGRLVTVERDGELLGTLRHVVKHSPTGVGWGYGGSGAADLALSLLVDALGPWAMCPTCWGRARVAQHAEEPDGRCWPYDPDRHSPLRSDGDSDGGGGWLLTGCWDCDDGLDPQLPYQQLKAEVVAALPAQGWVLARGQLLGWAAEHGVRLLRAG